MLIRLRLFSISFLSAVLLLLVLCLGSQNLKDRHKFNLFFASTAPLPTGFIIGISIITGVITGGSTAALLLPPSNSEK